MSGVTVGVGGCADVAALTATLRGMADVSANINVKHVLVAPVINAGIGLEFVVGISTDTTGAGSKVVRLVFTTAFPDTSYLVHLPSGLTQVNKDVAYIDVRGTFDTNYQIVIWYGA